MYHYKFHIGDYSSHTYGLSPTEDISYRRLIDIYYLKEKPPTGSFENIARDIGLASYRPDVEYVLEKYFKQDGDTWTHRRIEADITEYQEYIVKQSERGKASGAARKAKAELAKKTKSRASETDQIEPAFNERSTGVEPTVNREPLTDIKDTSSGDDLKGANSEKSPSCPVQQITDSYEETRNNLPQARVITEATKSHIRNIWKMDTKYQKLEFWIHFFNYCENNLFLSGRATGRDGAKPFKASLAWILKPANFAKIINEDYAQ